MPDGFARALTCKEIPDLAAGFVLGALEPDEMVAVRDHLATCPEAHAEVTALGAVTPALLASIEPAEPPAALRARVLAAVQADAAARGREATATEALTPSPASMGEAATTRRAATPIAPSRQGGPPSIVPFQRRFAFPARSPWTAVGIAAVLAIVVLGGWSLQLRSQVDQLTAYRQGVLTVIDEAAAPGAQLAVLEAPGGAGASGIAAVSSNGTLALAMRDLASTTGSQVYEAWLIVGQAAPVPVGGFHVDSGGTATFKSSTTSSAAGVIVALTLEPGPGATTPTLPLVAVGTAQPRAG